MGEKPKAMTMLPISKEDREELKEAIYRYAKKIQKMQQQNTSEQLQSKMETVNLRLKLINGCSAMSDSRLDHLLEIFKHYCTHIFRTGKYMTFDRLQYEKVHLIMERFFLFLKDFELTIMEANGKKQQVIEKGTIITIFKKISSNSKDLKFEEFIACLEKLAVIYYDEKSVFYEKKQKKKEEKEKRKRQFQNRKKKKEKQRMKKAGQSSDDNQDEDEQNQNEESDQNKENEEEKKESEQAQEQKKQEGEPEKEQNQNDDLVDDLMNDDQLEDPNQEVKKITNKYSISSQIEKETEQPLKQNKYQNLDDLLLILTNQEKIQYFYQFMIRVDDIKDYRKRLTDLDLPIFLKKKEKTRSLNQSQKKIKNISEEEIQRMEQLKKKMNEKKKLKQKASPIPKHKDDDVWQKAEEEKRRKRELKKQREQKAKKKNKEESDAVLQKKLDNQKVMKERQKQREKEKEKKANFNEKEINLDSLGKLSIDQLKLNKFNPNKFFNKDDDDKIFLDEYEGGRNRMYSGIRQRERHSISVVEDVRKRANEVEKKERKQEKQLDNISKRLGQNIPVKNRF